jgi:hypothetical protein
MTGMSLAWRLTGRGWADCTVADDRAEAEATASFISDAPEELLTAVARLIAGETETRVQFEAEPTVYRWIFCREGDDARVRLLQLADGSKHDKDGTEIWSSWQTTDALARAVIRGFDEAAYSYGESEYHGTWGRPFPRFELEALRNAWRDHRSHEPPNP